MSTPLTLTQLLNPPGTNVLLSQILAKLSASGFSATDWNSDSDARVILQVDAQAFSDLWQAVYKIALGGYLDTATGDWLTLLAQSQFQLARNPATQTIGNFTLSTPVGIGPYTFNKGDLVCTYVDSLKIARIFRSTNAAPVTTIPGGSIQIQMSADSPGSAWNIPVGSTLIVNTPQPGLTVSNFGTLQPASIIGSILNGPFFVSGQTLTITTDIAGGPPVSATLTFPANYPNMSAVVGTLNVLIAASPLNGLPVKNLVANTAGGALTLTTFDGSGLGIVSTVTLAKTGTANSTLGFSTTTDTTNTGTYAWVSQYGQDPEADDALRTRCQARWGTIGAGTKDAFISWATTADSAVQKTAVYSNVLAGIPKAGAVSLYIAGVGAFDAISGPIHVANVNAYVSTKLPIMTALFVDSAKALNVPITFTAKIKSAYNTDVTKAAVTTAVQNLFFSLNIGEVLYFDQVLAAIITIPGIVDAQLLVNGTKGDVLPANNQLVSLQSITPTYTIV